MSSLFLSSTLSLQVYTKAFGIHSLRSFGPQKDMRRFTSTKLSDRFLLACSGSDVLSSEAPKPEIALDKTLNRKPGAQSLTGRRSRIMGA